MLGAISHYFVALALGFTPANIVMPFQYVRMPGSVLARYLLFDDLPDALTWLGAAVVIASGTVRGMDPGATLSPHQGLQIASDPDAEPDAPPEHRS